MSTVQGLVSGSSGSVRLVQQVDRRRVVGPRRLGVQAATMIRSWTSDEADRRVRSELVLLQVALCDLAFSRSHDPYGGWAKGREVLHARIHPLTTCSTHADLVEAVAAYAAEVDDAVALGRLALERGIAIDDASKVMSYVPTWRPVWEGIGRSVGIKRAIW